jgi:diguanylate cyclase (GGDEF)-like protein
VVSPRSEQSFAFAAAEAVNGDPRQVVAMQAHLARIDEMREDIAKAWLVDVILASPLAQVEGMPMGWATSELPELVSDILAALAEPAEGLELSRATRGRAARLAELRAESAPEQLARDISSLQSALLVVLREELPDPQLFAEAAERLATVFGAISGTAIESLLKQPGSGADPLTGLEGPAQLRRRLSQLTASTKRYEQPFALVLIDFEGPGTREEEGGSSRETLLAIVAKSLQVSIRVMDEAFRLEDDQLCVVAPNQTVEDGARMAQRLAAALAELEATGGLRITISAGVVACPEQGDDPERLLRQADTAMWRARATGRAVAVGSLQDR